MFYDFCQDRSGEHPRRVLHAFAGTLVSDDYAAYHALHRRGVTKPIADALHAWLTAKRQVLAKADVTAKAIDYSLSNWTALTRFLDDGHVPIDNNAAENSVRPLAIGRRNWLFVGSQQAGERAGIVLSLIESAKLNGHDPWTYLKDVFERLPTFTSPIAAPTTAPELVTA